MARGGLPALRPPSSGRPTGTRASSDSISAGGGPKPRRKGTNTRIATGRKRISGAILQHIGYGPAWNAYLALGDIGQVVDGVEVLRHGGCWIWCGCVLLVLDCW